MDEIDEVEVETLRERAGPYKGEEGEREWRKDAEVTQDHVVCLGCRV